MRRRFFKSFAICIALCVSSAEALDVREGSADAVWTEEHIGEPLDLTGYDLIFSDEFDKDRISPDGGRGPWFAPIHYPWGVAKLEPPDGRTYSVHDGILTIRASKDFRDIWHSGSIQTVDSKGQGFAQQYGYFEARMKFPAMPGAWPAFWLKSQRDAWEKTLTRTEIDIVEWYGGDPVGHHRTVHLWPADRPRPGDITKQWWKGDYSKIPDLPRVWHDYGALITPDWVIVYLDRKELARIKSLSEFRTPLYPLVSLELYEKDAPLATSPVDLAVDYVRVYAPEYQ